MTYCAKRKQKHEGEKAQENQVSFFSKFLHCFTLLTGATLVNVPQDLVVEPNTLSPAVKIRIFYPSQF